MLNFSTFSVGRKCKIESQGIGKTQLFSSAKLDCGIKVRVHQTEVT